MRRRIPEWPITRLQWFHWYVRLWERNGHQSTTEHMALFYYLLALEELIDAE